MGFEKGSVPWNKGSSNGILYSPELRRKLSEAHRGHKASSLTRQKMSESLRTAWNRRSPAERFALGKKISETKRSGGKILHPKERIFCQMVRKQARKYGISVEELLRLWNSPCGICGITPRETGKVSNVDHDHETGRVRGHLCHHHNLLAGLVEALGSRLKILEVLIWVSDE